MARKAAMSGSEGNGMVTMASGANSNVGTTLHLRTNTRTHTHTHTRCHTYH